MYKLAFVLALTVQGLFAASATFQDPFDELERVSTTRSQEKALRIAAQEEDFVESFNRLASALQLFSKTYKATHTVDVKQVKSIREAYRKLEKADPWFRAE